MIPTERGGNLNIPQYFIGIDVASESFTVAIYHPQVKTTSSPVTLQNDAQGFHQLLQGLSNQGISPQTAIVCLEATGVYAEHLCYFLASKNYPVAVEPPHQVKRAFRSSLGKTDLLDSRQIAEYAFRFFDQLHLWHPSEQILEEMKVLLSTREQFTQQLTANQNALKAILRKVVKTPLAEKTYGATIDHLKEQIRTIDREIKNLISNHPTFGPLASLVLSIPGVGYLLTANLLILTQGFSKVVTARQVASHVGICPLEFQSGTSIYKKPKSRRFGPSKLRKLLYLAALSLRTHDKTFKAYFLRKVEEGKAKRLVLNNIANRLLKIIFSIVRSQLPFIANYRSIHPRFLKTA